MKIVIIGGGKIGSVLCEQLAQEGHDVTIIDRAPLPLQKLSQKLDILCIEGDGALADVQLEAGVDKADLAVAVTASDELNLLCCLLAKNLGAQHTIARVRIPGYERELSLIAGDLGLSLSVNPDLICAREMARSLRVASAIKADAFSGGRVEMLQLRVEEGSILAGKTLAELPALQIGQVLICAVERGEDEITIPSGVFRLEAGDRISIITAPQNAQAFFKKIRLETTPVRRVTIAGGSRVAYYLARQLLDLGVAVTIIEQRYERCEELSELLPRATVLHGDATNETTLLESGLAEADAFASLTGIDEENMLVGMAVRKTFPQIKVLTKVTRGSFQSILKSVDAGCIFNPRQSAANLICRYVRAMQNSAGSAKVETLYKLVGGKVEALEFLVAEETPFCGVSLQALRLRPNILIGAIFRKGKLIIPRGQDTIECGDRVIVVTSVPGLKDLQDVILN